MVKVCYPAIFHPEEVGYSVMVPDFDQVNIGCVTQGDTFEEACSMAFDAIKLCIETLINEGKALPVASKLEGIEKRAGDFVVPITVDNELGVSL